MTKLRPSIFDAADVSSATPTLMPSTCLEANAALELNLSVSAVIENHNNETY